MWNYVEAQKVNEKLVDQYMKTGQWGEAEAVLRKAAEEFPYDSTVLARLGTVLWQSGKHREALETLEKALMLDQDDVHVIEATITAFVALGRHQDAEDILRAYVERNPWERDISQRLEGLLSCEVTNPVPDPNERFVRGEKAETNGSESRVLLRIGEEEFSKHNFDRARVCFELAYEKDPQSAKVLNNLGVVAWQDGDVARALEYFQKALDADPIDEEVLLNSAHALADLAEWDTAADLLQIYLTRHHNDEQAWSDYRRFVQAAAALWKPDGLPKAVADTYVEMGRKLEGLGDYQGAIEAYGRALRISSDSADAYYGLGLLERNLQRNQEAAEMFRAALGVDPSHERAAEALRMICGESDDS